MSTMKHEPIEPNRTVKRCSLVIIARPTEEEKDWISYFAKSTYAHWFHRIVVDSEVLHVKNRGGWTQEAHAQNLDCQICRKKNIGAASATEEYCLVCHADTYPSSSFLDALQTIDVGENEVLCPAGRAPNGVMTLTWAEPRGNPPGSAGFFKPWDEPFVEGKTYISGAAIFARTALFRRFPWDESLRHGQGEDVEYSRRLEANGITQRCEPRLVVNMKRSQ